MLISAKVLINKAILIILFSFFIQSSAIATEATLLKVGSWGSNTYLDEPAFVGDYVFQAQRDSNTIDVQSSNVNEQGGLVNQIEISQIISAVYSFREYLVVATQTKLIIVDVSDLDNPVEIYSITVRNPTGYNHNIYYTDDENIVFVDGDSRLFVLGYENEMFEIVGLYQGPEDDYQAGYYIGDRSVALEDDSVYYAYSIINYNNDVSNEVSIESLKWMNGNLTQRSKFVESVENGSSNRLVYIDNGNFAAASDGQKIIFYVAVLDGYDSILSGDTYSNPSSLKYNSNKLWMVSRGLNLTILNIDDINATVVENNSMIQADNSTLRTNPYIVFNENRSFLKSSHYLGEVTPIDDDTFSVTNLYSQSGSSGSIAVNESQLFVPKANRLQVLDISNPIVPQPETEIYYDGQYFSRNILQNEETIFVTDTYYSRFQATEIDDLLFPDDYIDVYAPSNGDLLGTEVVDDYIFSYQSNDDSIFRFDADSHFSVLESPDEM